MSRMPPIPSASRPTHGPDAEPKTSVDISHRVRHQALRVAQEAERQHQQGKQDAAFWTVVVTILTTVGLAKIILASKRRTINEGI